MQQSPTASPSSRTPWGLLIIALLAIGLSAYQWRELLAMRSEGVMPGCSISEKIDCAAVWNSPLADVVHHYTFMPFAGWGMAWGLMVLILALLWRRRNLKQQDASEPMLALRLTTGIGSIICIALLLYSVTISTFCPTCGLFYLLVGVSSYLVWKNTRPTVSFLRAVPYSLGLLIVILAALLYPALHTPRQDNSVTTLTVPTDAASVVNNNDPLAHFLLSLPPEDRQTVSDIHALYHQAPLISRPVDGNRLIFGSTRAPVHLLDWIDIRCPHCKHLEEALNEIRKVTPTDSWSEEARHFPLDHECNPQVSRSSGGISCLAAKVLICLAGSPKGNVVRDDLFKEQTELDINRIWRIAAQTSAQRASLEQCVSSPQTLATLKDDIDYATQYHLDGTPLLVINGRRALAFPPFIYAMIVAGGDDGAPGFRVLPTPHPEELSQ